MREPFVVATENDSLNGVAMLMGHQLTGTAQVFADVRTYWSPEAIERVTGHKLDGLAEHGIIHLINSGSAALDGSCKQRDSEGNPTMKPHWKSLRKRLTLASPLPNGARRSTNTSVAAVTLPASLPKAASRSP